MTANGRPADVLTLRPGAMPVFSFDLDDGDHSPHLGSISGRLVVSGTNASFVDVTQDCRLDLTSYGDRLVVVQKSTCGFGEGVSAAGRYTAAEEARGIAGSIALTEPWRSRSDSSRAIRRPSLGS